MDTLAWAWRMELDTASKFVLIDLADRAADHESDNVFRCWPGVDKIANRTGLSERTVRDRIKVLESIGLISKEMRRKGDKQTSNVYTLNIEMTPEEARVRLRAYDNLLVGVEPLVEGAADANPGCSSRQSQGADLAPEPKEEQPEVETLAPTARRVRQNFLWDSLVEHFGSPSTKSESSNLGKTVTEVANALRQVQPLFSPTDEQWVPFIRQQVGLRVEQMGEQRYRTHPALRSQWTRLGALAGIDGEGVIFRSAEITGPITWEDADVNPLGQLTECEICGEDEGNHHEQCPNA